MFSTNTNLEIRSGGAASLYTCGYEFPDTILVKHLEWIVLQNALLKICWEELGHVVARVTECHLCEVVSSKGKEFCFSRNLI